MCRLGHGFHTRHHIAVDVHVIHFVKLRHAAVTVTEDLVPIGVEAYLRRRSLVRRPNQLLERQASWNRIDGVLHHDSTTLLVVRIK